MGKGALDEWILLELTLDVLSEVSGSRMVLGIIRSRILRSVTVEIHSHHLEFLAIFLELFLLLVEVPFLLFSQKQIVILEKVVLFRIVVLFILVCLEDVHFCDRRLTVWVRLMSTVWLNDCGLTHMFPALLKLANNRLMSLRQYHETVRTLVVELNRTFGRLQSVEVGM